MDWSEATMMELPSHDHLMAREEMLAPLQSVIEVECFEEVIEIENDGEYDLCTNLFTVSAKRVLQRLRILRARTVRISTYGEGDILTPIGDCKKSGFGGRDSGVHTHDQSTQVKTIWFNLSDDDVGVVS